ncbi:YhfC family intramembrane metalloprotease [Bacillus sp. JCM 19034]|uniref:YhfC family intramembrane metalloprotease n=1 Tax=Bacillus sp. JCM 19034 TaxID=1481928 RepID=UPI000780CF92|nr:YhfC family intramembrane metalloprotease [Bacillus sp. JCM 19034]
MTIDNAVINALYANVVLSIIIPVTVIVFAKVKYKISFKVLLVGSMTFIVFSQILENIVHVLLIGIGENPVSSFIMQPYIFAVYGPLMAGIFEETGRFLVLSYILKKYRDWKDGFSFGIGHGGIEVFIILGISSIGMIALTTLINEGSIADPILVEQLSGLSMGTSLLGALERVFAMCLHIALSILILYGIKTARISFLFLAIGLHTVFNIPAGLYQANILTNILLIEVIIGIFAILAVIFIIKSKRLFEIK